MKLLFRLPSVYSQGREIRRRISFNFVNIENASYRLQVNAIVPEDDVKQAVRKKQRAELAIFQKPNHKSLFVVLFRCNGDSR